MHAQRRSGRMTAQTWGAILVFSLPILIGILFWADGSGHVDSIAYRQMIEATWREGRIPPARMEWYHPGQYLVAAPIFGLGEWLGLWSEALRVCSLLNFLALGLAGWTVMRMVQVLYPERSGSLALFAGLCTVTVPGWLWHSQEALTDVLGHALILTWACRLLIHECRARTLESDGTRRGRVLTHFSWAITGFIATYAIMIRVSSALFGLLFLYLWIRALVATPTRRSRITKSSALIVGALIPIVGIFAHLVIEYGWTNFWNIYFEFSSDNVGMKVSFGRLGEVWLERIQNGTGPVLFWAGLVGAATLLVQMVRPSARRIFSNRVPLFYVCTLLTLPYFIAVARNRAWYEFRYLLPAMMLLSLATIAWASMADRFFGRWFPRILMAGIIVSNLIYAGPWLYAFGTRSPFLEVAVKETMRIAEPGSLLLGHMSASHMRYRSRGRFATMGVRYDSSEGGIDFWNASWSHARQTLINASVNVRHAYCYNEHGLDGFLQDLAKRGWKTEVVFERGFEGLRNAVDENLGTMQLELALRPSQLEIMRLLPPPNLEAPVTLNVTRGTVDPGQPGQEGLPVYRLHVASPKNRGWHYRLILAKKIVKAGQILPGQIYLPFGTKDPLVALSLSAQAQSRAPLNLLVGTLDEQGSAEIQFPSSYSETIHGAFVTALLYGPRSNWVQAMLRSPTQRIP